MQRPFRTEDEFVAWVKRRLRDRGAAVRLSVGDDAALVESAPGRLMILTSDLTIEGVHFSTPLHPADAVGHRALARSLSDVAAMGGRPRFALVSLGLSRRVNRAWIESFYRGMLRLARRFAVRIVGGDTAVTADSLAADVVVLGDVDRGKALLRSGARPGDSIFVAGTLGKSALGLRALRSGLASRFRGAVRAHLYPQPQCELGQYLSNRRLASAAVDISDGFSTDLGRLLEASRAGASVCEDRIREASFRSSGAPALPLALDGGEDYKLLFTASPHKARLVPRTFKGIRIYEIGTVCEPGRGITLDGPSGSRPLRPRGYDHFRPRRK